MVDRISRRGYSDWLVQRITSLLIGIYTVFLIIFLLTHHPISYAQWCALFTRLTMKIFTLLVIFSLLWHTWIGMWTIFTDYVKNKSIRLVLETIVFLLLDAYFIWAIKFLWTAR